MPLSTFETLRLDGAVCAAYRSRFQDQLEVDHVTEDAKRKNLFLFCVHEQIHYLLELFLPLGN